ncbi:MAG: hypothetical protein ABEJ46_01310, partial [Gemmatimonadota bacterium]
GALGLLLALAALVAAPGPADAQWVNDPGEGWIKVSVFHHDTDEEYTSSGEVRPFFADGHMITTSTFVNGEIGVQPGLDLWYQAPVHHFQFDDAAGDRTKTGIGDIRGWLRIGPEAFGLGEDPLPVPGSDFPVDAEVIPLTEGQRDWELLVEVGRSFHPLPLYAKGWVGRRWRERNAEILWDPGDETFAFLAVGGGAGPVSWELAAEGLWSDPPVKEGIRLENEERKMIQLMPKLGVETGLGPVQLEVGAQLPVDGRNLPAGPSLRAGFFSPVRL